MKARRVEIQVKYKGIDITREIDKNLLSFQYVDNASDEADNITLTLEDRSNKWLDAWHPEKGDRVEASIRTINWNKDGETDVLPCGSFIIDEPEYSGPPDVITIKGIAIPLNDGFTETKKSKAWENISLRKIAAEIAAESGLRMFFDSSEDPFFDRIEQNQKSDLGFLAELSTKQGLGFKVTNDSIVIFNESDYESKAPVMSYQKGRSDIISYGFKTSLKDTAYDGCRVKYFDPQSGKKTDYLLKTGKGNKIYEARGRVKDWQEVERTARKKLRELNKKETVASLSVVGNTALVGGVCIELSEFGVYSGKYFVEKVSHNMSPYGVNIEARKILEGGG